VIDLPRKTTLGVGEEFPKIALVFHDKNARDSAALLVPSSTFSTTGSGSQFKGHPHKCFSPIMFHPCSFVSFNT
jgi:hypothetical protein